MEKDANLIAYLRTIANELYNTDLFSENFCNELNQVIKKLDPVPYPLSVDNIEIRPVTNFFNRSTEKEFDVVKWFDDSHTSCYSLGTLYWNDHEEWFEFNGVGTRLFEAAPSKEVCDMIVNFCRKMTKKYQRGNKDE